MVGGGGRTLRVVIGRRTMRSLDRRLIRMRRI